MKTLYFDEAGYTGNNLLDKDQAFFCYLGIESDSDKEKLFASLKKKYNYIDSEVKGKNICRSNKGQKFLTELWDNFGPSVKYVIHNKKYALACKLFEYTYEPVFSEVNTLLYGMGFHTFMASFFYTGFIASDKTAESIFNGFYQFVKEQKPGYRLELLGHKPEKDHPLSWFYNFCVNNKKEIVSDIDFNSEIEHWLLDLTSTSLFSLLTQFAGNSAEPLKVFCDESRPLFADTSMHNIMIGDERVLYQYLAGKKLRINFNLQEAIIPAKSKDILSIQIADILAASICYAVKNEKTEFGQMIIKNTASSFINDNSILPLNLISDVSISNRDIYLRLMYELSRKTNKSKKIQEIYKYSYLYLLNNKILEP